MNYYLEWNRIKKTRMSVFWGEVGVGLVIDGYARQVKSKVHSLIKQIFTEYLPCSRHYIGTGETAVNDIV